MSRSCVCGGANENCRFCGGLGTIPDELGNALMGRIQELAAAEAKVSSTRIRGRLVSHRGRTKAAIPSVAESRIRTKRNSIPRNLILCPQGCRAWVHPRNVDRHLRKVHRQSVSSLPQTETIVPTNPVIKDERPKYESCPLCHANLRAGRAKQHMARCPARKAIATKPERQILPAPKRRLIAVLRMPASVSSTGSSAAPLERNMSPGEPVSPPPTKKYTVCPICKANIRPGRISSHMSKVHKRKGRGRNIVQSSNDPLRKNTSLIAKRDKNLDVTKPYAHPYREQGRFGSHPSHDGFGDESGPE